MDVCERAALSCVVGLPGEEAVSVMHWQREDVMRG